MKIKFDNWKISIMESDDIYQRDNLTQTVTLEGVLPPSYAWFLLLESDNSFDKVPFANNEILLTARSVPVDGYYAMQIVGIDGDKVRHTNILNRYINHSIVGDEHYTEIPSEFSDFEERLNGILRDAEDARDSSHEYAKASSKSATASEASAKDSANSADKAKNSADRADKAKNSIVGTEDRINEAETRITAIKGEIDATKTQVDASATNAKQSEDNASTSASNASQSAEQAKQSADNAKVSETNTKTSETNAESSETQSSKNLADLLAMIGTSIPSLVDGLIPLKYIPATATVEVYKVQSESELTSLVAQRGDIAELVEDVNGEKTITKTWQLLGNDASVRDNWVVWGTSYSVQSGSATIAETANNAERINNMRLVTMNYSDFETAVKDAQTLYAVDMEA